MSISAIAANWSSPSGTDPFLTASTSQSAAAFQASLAQWEQYGGGATTQATASGQTQAEQSQSADGMQRHHHHHGVQTDGGEQSGANPIQTALSNLVTDIAGTLQAGGSGQPGGSSTASATDASSAAGATQAGSAGSASIQVAANTLVTDIAQAMQAYGTSPTNNGTSAIVL